MKDLIDRLNDNPTDTIYRNDAVDALAYFDERSPTGKTAQDIIIGLTSVQPEIVRCKDCKYVGTDATCCLVCDREGMGLRPYHVRKDDYCSYAERRIDEPD